MKKQNIKKGITLGRYPYIEPLIRNEFIDEVLRQSDDKVPHSSIYQELEAKREAKRKDEFISTVKTVIIVVITVIALKAIFILFN